ncbi:MAG: hypothetical protein GMKNLPBB_00576 [Myxococcota bacterium]|nr:hypothetical protein [Myxococcota bacterium]
MVASSMPSLWMLGIFRLVVMSAERPIYITQPLLDKWVSQGKVILTGTHLTIPAQNKAYDLVPAVRFIKVVSGEGDPHGLIGKIRTPEQIKALNGEHYMDSVLLGEIAYEVEEGFLGLLAGGDTPAPEPTRPDTNQAVAIAPQQPASVAQASVPAAPPAANASTPAAKPEDDIAALTSFLLKNM